MLWQLSYAELYFPDTYFPDFDEKKEKVVYLRKEDKQ